MATVFFNVPVSPELTRRLALEIVGKRITLSQRPNRVGLQKKRKLNPK